MKSLFLTHTSQLKGRDPLMPVHISTTGYLFSINILLPTTGRLSCELLKLPQFKQCFLVCA